MLSARPDLKKYTALHFRQAIKRHADAIGPGEDVVLVFMEALELDPPLTLVCSDLHLQIYGYPVGQGRRSRSRCCCQVIEAQPYGELANKAKEVRGSIARRDLRQAQPVGLQAVAPRDLPHALQLFEGMEQQRFVAVLSDVAPVGQGGLQIKEPGTSKTLKSLPGSWSDLALTYLIHAGMKRLTPDQDSGLGIEAEYLEAVRFHGPGGR